MIGGSGGRDLQNLFKKFGIRAKVQQFMTMTPVICSAIIPYAQHLSLIRMRTLFIIVYDDVGAERLHHGLYRSSTAKRLNISN